MIDLALHYARARYPVFPLGPLSKAPVISRADGGHGCLDATTSESLIEAWWNQYPEANVGIATGRISGLFVVDVDVREGKPGLASIQELKLPATFTVRTPSRGFHLYFLMPSQHLTVGADLLPGIDWRGEGGYVVAAGSRTREGTYEIARNLPIAALPQSIVDRILAHRAQSVATVAADGRFLIPKGTRDQSLTRIAGALRRYGLGEVAILAALQAANTEHCSPPLSDAQLVKIAHSVVRYPPAVEARKS